MKIIQIQVASEKQIPETIEECNEVVTCFNCAYDIGTGKTEKCKHRVVLADEAKE